jgi:hypothetical protein
MQAVQDYEQREYLIFPVTSLQYVEFDQVLETSALTVRKSVNGLKTLDLEIELNQTRYAFTR